MAGWSLDRPPGCWVIIFSNNKHLLGALRARVMKGFVVDVRSQSPTVQPPCLSRTFCKGGSAAAKRQTLFWSTSPGSPVPTQILGQKNIYIYIYIYICRCQAAQSPCRCLEHEPRQPSPHADARQPSPHADARQPSPDPPIGLLNENVQFAYGGMVIQS